MSTQTVSAKARIYVQPQHSITAKAHILAHRSTVTLRGTFEVSTTRSVSLRGKFYINAGSAPRKTILARARIVREGSARLTGFFVVADPLQGDALHGSYLTASSRTERILSARARIIK